MAARGPELPAVRATMNQPEPGTIIQNSTQGTADRRSLLSEGYLTEIAPLCTLDEGHRNELLSCADRIRNDRALEHAYERFARLIFGDRRPVRQGHNPTLSARTANRNLLAFCDARHEPLLAAWIYLAQIPQTLARYRERAIPHEILRDTLTDIPLWMQFHKRQTGRYGLTELDWLVRHLEGRLFRIGRLQFGVLPYPGPSELGMRRGEPVIDVHIPEGEPLDDEACVESYRSAGAFFEKHFPEVRPRAFYCSSWLLSPELGEVLPSTSNIRKFFGRYDLTSERENDSQLRERVFGSTEVDLSRAPKDTTLRRVVLEAMAEGIVFHCGSGIIRLSSMRSSRRARPR